jgi:hypothetical protein
MPSNDPKDLRPPIKYKPRRVARQLSEAEIKAAADRAEARSSPTTVHQTDEPSNSSGSKPRGIVVNPPAVTSVIEG